MTRPAALLRTCREAVQLAVFLAIFFPGMGQAQAQTPVKQKAGDQAQVMQSFEVEGEAKQAASLSDRRKHRVMFLLGVPLLIVLLGTGGLGIAMGVYGRQVFVWHMILAGFAVTLAIVHAIVGLVWFYPF
jgi:hypothetical protein